MLSVADVMTTDVVTASPDGEVGWIRDQMLRRDIHAVPVVDGAGEVVGIVASSDAMEEWPIDLDVATVMTVNVRTVAPGTSVVDAARQMLDTRIHHLVVVGPRGLAGIVSSFDLLRALGDRVEVAESRALPGRQHASPGDHIVIRGHAVDERERRGLIVEARGPDGGPPFVVNWLDDPNDEPHDVLFFPGSDADVEAKEDG